MSKLKTIGGTALVVLGVLAFFQMFPKLNPIPRLPVLQKS